MHHQHRTEVVVVGSGPGGATVARDLETQVSGLYVCDANVFPEALCRPPSSPSSRWPSGWPLTC